MKDKAKFAVSMIFISPFVALSIIVLQGSALAQSPDTPVTNSQSTTNNSVDETPAKVEARNKRLQERKAKQELRLNQVQKTKLANSCRPAQAKIQSLSVRTKSIESHRTVMYKDLIARLSSVYDRLKDGKIDVIEYGNQLEELKSQTDVFLSSIDAHKLQLSDLELMDCVADPDAFYATLEESRKSHKDLKTQSQKIKTHLSSVLRPQINSIIQQLNSTQAGSN